MKVSPAHTLKLLNDASKLSCVNDFNLWKFLDPENCISSILSLYLQTLYKHLSLYIIPKRNFFIYSLNISICFRKLSNNVLLGDELSNNLWFLTGYLSETRKLGLLEVPSYRTFVLDELREATNNFDISNLIGESSSGQVLCISLLNTVRPFEQC